MRHSLVQEIRSEDKRVLTHGFGLRIAGTKRVLAWYTDFNMAKSVQNIMSAEYGRETEVVPYITVFEEV